VAASLLFGMGLGSLDRERVVDVGLASFSFLASVSVCLGAGLGCADSAFFFSEVVGVVAFRSLTVSFTVFTFPLPVGGGSGGSVAGL